MTQELRQRATVIVPWGEGVIVHADHKGHWWLPGGKIERTLVGHPEEALVAAVRELREETGLVAHGAILLFHHTGTRNDHHVFLAQASGTPAVVDQREAPAIGIVNSNLHVTWIVVTPGCDVSSMRPMSSSQTIIRRYFALRDQHPALWTGLAEVEASRRDSVAAPMSRPPESAPAPASPKPDGQTVQFQIGAAVLELTIGDLVVQDVDAIVNAANEALAEGAGVCGAIFGATDRHKLAAACRPLAPCPTGEARITASYGGTIQAPHIIHAVGPDCRRPKHQANAAHLLASAYRASVSLAVQQGLTSVAFPSLSTGIFAYPIHTAACVALGAVRDVLSAPSSIALVRFVLREQESFAAYKQAADELGLPLVGQKGGGLAKKIYAVRPGQLLVVETMTDLTQIDAPGWIVDIERTKASGVRIHSAMRMGYWVAPTEEDTIPPGMTFPVEKPR